LQRSFGGLFCVFSYSAQGFGALDFVVVREKRKTTNV